MKVLNLLPESIGDFLLVSPSLNSVEQHFKNEEIIWWIPESLSEVSKLISSKAVKKFFSFEKNGTFKNKEIFKSLKSSSRTIDITLCFPPAVKYYRLARKIGTRIRAGYSHEDMLISRVVSKIYLTHHWICPSNSKIHELEAYGQILTLLKIPFIPSFPELTLSENSFVWSKNWLQKASQSSSPKIISVHLGSRWVENPLIHLRQFLKNHADFFLLILFSQQEEKKARGWITEFERFSETGMKKILIPGVISLEQYAAFLKLSQMLIAVDGGPVHLASALKTPILVFYPDDQFEFRAAKWHPWGTSYKAAPLTKKEINSLSKTVQEFAFLSETT